MMDTHRELMVNCPECGKQKASQMSSAAIRCSKCKELVTWWE